MSRGLVFQTIKEHRGDYFVQYAPAASGDLFALLTLTFLQSHKPADIAKLMDQESVIWIQRYSVPLMTSSADDSGSLIHLTGTRDCDHLIALPTTGGVIVHWKMLQDCEFPQGPLQEKHLLDVYRDIPFSTLEDRHIQAVSRAKRLRLGVIIIALWGLAVPITVGLTGLASPVLGYLIIAYSISKAIHKASKMLGYVKRSKRENQKDAEELRMRHHHDHCERNPEGFLRLKAENFEREARDETRREEPAA
ncbi:MAG: hypothetical protein KAV00_05585 [Phycisphaerae bacterium]|nr:hypothetical protein [Phycisphaerae bacterium]